jgi:hypothetical protein
MSEDVTLTVFSQAETWHLTGELRFVGRWITVEHGGEQHMMRDEILQQKWVNMSNGAEEWRDVPLVEEGT